MKVINKRRIEGTNNKWVITNTVIILAFITWGLIQFSKHNSKIIEKIYSNIIYPSIAVSISSLISLVPISLAEIFLLAGIIILIIGIIFAIIKPKKFLSSIPYIFHWSIRGIVILYILFYFLWGFNYYREDYIDIFDLNKEPATLDELKNLTHEVIIKLNDIRANLKEDDNGIFMIEDSFRQLSQQAHIGFESLGVGKNAIGKHNNVKPIFMSKLMSYTGITGIYFPYTSEANVNIDIPPSILPATICHEMAHQRGFAKEEEANFIAYLACINNSDNQFKYSGYYLAMQYLMSDLYKTNEDVYYTLYSLLSDSVKRDMGYSRSYWREREGRAEKVATAMNDNYLKANNQKQGVKSYNGVVKLLLAEYKSK